MEFSAERTIRVSEDDDPVFCLFLSKYEGIAEGDLRDIDFVDFRQTLLRQIPLPVNLVE